MRLEQAYAALRFEPAIPWWALAALAALCLLALLPALVRRARGTFWRGLAFAVLLAWLAGPRLVRETRDTLPDIALLVVDHTASMQVNGREAIAQQAQKDVEAQVARMPGLELRTVEVPEAGHDGTALFAAASRALADIPRSRLSAILAITDGQVHDRPDGALPAPLQVLVPAKGEETDRRLRIIEAPSFGIVGKGVTLRVAVDDLGPHRDTGPVRITVRRNGEPPETVLATPGAETPIEVPIPRAGPITVDMAADPLPGEVSPINNRAVVTVNGVRDRLRVLLVSGEPHAGERTWRRLLKADPSVDLVHFTILRPPDRDDLTPLNELALIAFPVRELFQVKIREFDLIILDRFQNRGILPLPYLRNIADYVRAGGGLLVSAGPEFTGASSLAPTPVGSVLPVRPGAVVDGAFRPLVTPLGLRHPVTEALPGANEAPGSAQPSWGSWYRHITPAAPAATAQNLMAAPDGTPLLMLDHVDRGRVALLLSDQIWLWSRGHEGGGPQAELLRRLAHWLMKEPALEEEALRATIADGTLKAERRTVLDTPPEPLTVIGPDGARTPLPLHQAGPGLFTAELPAALPGVYQVTDGTRSAFAAATIGNPQEIADLRATASVLQPLSRASGGSVQFIEDRTGALAMPELRRTEPGHEAAGSGWVGLPRRRDHVVTGVEAIPLLPPWAALPILLGVILVAWRKEGAS